jgi:hypothetical protein
LLDAQSTAAEDGRGGPAVRRCCSSCVSDDFRWHRGSPGVLGARVTEYFLNSVITRLHTQAEGTRQAAQQLVGQQQRAQEVTQELTQASTDTYLNLLNSIFSFYQGGTSRAKKRSEEAERRVEEAESGRSEAQRRAPKRPRREPKRRRGGPRKRKDGPKRPRAAGARPRAKEVTACR